MFDRYLDMNGIIHVCSHPNDDDPHFRITEEKIFKDIFHYIEVLFRMIQPRKVFFMAIDGVAPRAKMNQQRGRRFRSARESELNEAKARDRGEVLPSEARFDSNCITPGTLFMDRLHQQLKYFIVSKISTDPLWQQGNRLKVIYSGHDTPGEGEHKIMDYIRYERTRPGYDHNTRHCLYGLDADLIMLSLCTHEPHFSLLREEVRFGSKKQNASNKRISLPEETTFHLLHISLFREYLDLEFGPDLKPQMSSFGYKLESIIDDWILMGFLVGNDFIPHLPHLHIKDGALPELYQVYKEVLPSLGGYINEGGTLNLERFERFMIALSTKELDRFDEIYANSKWLEGKKAQKNTVQYTPGPGAVHEMLMGNTEPGVSSCSNMLSDPDLRKLLALTDEFCPPEEEDMDVYDLEFMNHKREYYRTKLGYDMVTPAVLLDQAECYVRAIQWNLHYYYDGCVSWSWFYPHHYAPWISDIRGFTQMKMNFTYGQPFLPFEQLMAVLPASSRTLLPKALQYLMVSDSSPIIEFYPIEFETDLNGKKQDWEAVVLIPFINEHLLLEAIKEPILAISTEEKARNSVGPATIYSYNDADQGFFNAPQYFHKIEHNHTSTRMVGYDEWNMVSKSKCKGLLPHVRLDVFFPGFPTMKHIPHSASLKAEGIRVFEQNSRGQSLIVSIDQQNIEKNLCSLTKSLIGQEIWVSWPHMTRALVEAVSSSLEKATLDPEVFNKLHISNVVSTEFTTNSRSIKERYMNRWGIDIGQTHYLVYARVMTGCKYICSARGRISLERQWTKNSIPFALQTTCVDILSRDPSFQQYRTLDELFPVDTTCFMLGKPLYGCQGKVVEINHRGRHKGLIQVMFIEPKEFDLSCAFNQLKDFNMNYMSGSVAARRLGIEPHFLSRITGSIFILRGSRDADPDKLTRINIGLNLKFNKRNEEVYGYTKKSENGFWLYSEKTVSLIKMYRSKFSRIFIQISNTGHNNSDYFYFDEIFNDDDENGENLINWLKECPSNSCPRQPCGSLRVDEKFIAILERTLLEQQSDRKRHLMMQVRPHLLLNSNFLQGNCLPDADATFNLLDRVVNIRQGCCVPLGLRGTIIAINRGIKAITEDTMLEILFDTSFNGGISIRSSSERSYRLPVSAVINISYGNRTQTPPPKATVVFSPLSEVSQPKKWSYAVPLVKAPAPESLPAPYLPTTEQLNANLKNMLNIGHEQEPSAINRQKSFFNVPLEEGGSGLKHNSQQSEEDRDNKSPPDRHRMYKGWIASKPGQNQPRLAIHFDNP